MTIAFNKIINRAATTTEVALAVVFAVSSRRRIVLQWAPMRTFSRSRSRTRWWSWQRFLSRQYIFRYSVVVLIYSTRISPKTYTKTKVDFSFYLYAPMRRLSLAWRILFVYLLLFLLLFLFSILFKTVMFYWMIEEKGIFFLIKSNLYSSRNEFTHQ